MILFKIPYFDLRGIPLDIFNGKESSIFPVFTNIEKHRLVGGFVNNIYNDIDLKMVLFSFSYKKDCPNGTFLRSVVENHLNDLKVRVVLEKQYIDNKFDQMVLAGFSFVPKNEDGNSYTIKTFKEAELTLFDKIKAKFK